MAKDKNKTGVQGRSPWRNSFSKNEEYRIMQLKVFAVSAQGGEEAVEEMNKFLRNRRIASVKNPDTTPLWLAGRGIIFPGVAVPQPRALSRNPVGIGRKRRPLARQFQLMRYRHSQSAATSVPFLSTLNHQPSTSSLFPPHRP